MAGLINLRLLTDFFNKIAKRRHSRRCQTRYRKSRGAKGSGVGLVAARRMNLVLSHAALIRSDLASR